MDWQLFSQLVVNGIAVGCIIALSSVGLTITYGVLRLVNFSHGDFLTVGAYMTLIANIWFGWNVWLSIVFGAALAIAIALICEKLIWSPLRDARASMTTLIIVAIGLALFLRNGVILIWGGGNHSYDVPVAKAIAIDVLGMTVDIAYYQLLVIALTAIAIVVLHYMLQRSKIGKAMRAVSDNIDLARVSGINVERVAVWTWVIAIGMTALGGSMYGLMTAVRPNMGWFLIIPMFTAIILGGIGNPYGAIAGALVTGIAQEAGIYWLPTAYKPAIPLVIMIVVLLFRPQGIFRGTI
jgi:neutral amino acid transport system permease protein